MKKKRILITGSRGYLGTYLCDFLKNQRSYLIYEFEDDILSENLEIPEVDVVVHLAAKLNTFKGDESILMDTNFLGTQKLLEKCNSNVHFIFSSTDYVFKSSFDKQYGEDDTKEPETLYGQSKSLAEDFLVSKHKKLTILRISMLYGYVHLHRKNFFDYVIESLSSNTELNLFTDVISRPTFVNDVCLSICKTIENQIFGLFHISGPDYLSRFEIGKTICEMQKKDSSLIIPCEKDKAINIPQSLNLRPSKRFRKQLDTKLRVGLNSY